MGLFGWSYPAGCSGPPEDESFHELEALEEEIWERPELKRMSEKNKRSLTDWITKLVSDAKKQAYHQMAGESQMAEALEAERVLAEHWKNNPGEQVDDNSGE